MVSSAEVFSVFPPGVILAWHAHSGNVPAGWAICDGANGTPDLRGKFLRGVSNFADVGGHGGNNTSQITVVEDGRRVSDWRWGDTPWASGPNPARGGQSFTIDNRPPYFDVLYIMKN